MGTETALLRIALALERIAAVLERGFFAAARPAEVERILQRVRERDTE